MNVFQTKPVRWFSAISVMMPKSIPSTSVSYQPERGLNASTKLYLCHAFGKPLWMLRSTAMQSEDRNGMDPPSRTWNDGTIDWPHRRWPAPRHIAARRVRRRDSPQFAGIIGKLTGERRTEQLVGLRRGDGVVEVVGVGVLLVAKVEPGVGILVDKQWRAGIRDVSQALVSQRRTRKCLPCARRNRVRGRANRQQIQHHQLGVSVPARRQKSVFRRPAHGKCTSAVEHPRPVDALIDLRRQVYDLLVLKVLPAGEYAAQQDCGINRRDLRVVYPLPGVHIHEVVEETVLVRHLVEKETQRSLDTRNNAGAGHVATLVRNAKSS